MVGCLKVEIGYYFSSRNISLKLQGIVANLNLSVQQALLNTDRVLCAVFTP